MSDEKAPPARTSRLVPVVVGITALFSIAASVAVLMVLVRSRDDTARVDDDHAGDQAAPLVAPGPRPAAFQHASDGVAVVPPSEAASAPEPRARPTPPPAPEAAAPEPAAADLPDAPDPAAVASAMAKLEKDIAACAAPAKVSGEVGIKMRIEPDGSVAWAAARVQNVPFQACLDRLFRKARMPRSQKGGTVKQAVQLP